MKLIFRLWKLLIPLCLLLSCQKELSFENGEQLASRILAKDATSECMQATTGGKFKVGKILNDSNYLQVSVIVRTTGNFKITSNTLNGYHFENQGVFIDTGLHIIKLDAIGKPASAGINYFTVSLDSSTCTFPVTVSPEKDSIPHAIFTLAGAPANCSPINVFGSYIKNIAMTSEDSVVLSVSVISAGRYSIATGTVNNISFNDSGIFTSPGIQQVRVKASGTPTLSGSYIFSVGTAVSQCTFPITVTAPVSAVGTDYFPLTLNSYWTYDDLVNPDDTLKRTVVDSVSKNGASYKQVFEINRYSKDTSYFRRQVNTYYEYGSVDKYTRSLVYVPSVKGDLNFLNAGLSTGDKWTTTEYVGNLFSGQPVYTTYNYYCADANYAITLKGNSFTNVYRILLFPQVRSSLVYPYNSTAEVIEVLYARGIGLIYYKKVKDGFKNAELQIRHWKVF